MSKRREGGLSVAPAWLFLIFDDLLVVFENPQRAVDIDLGLTPLSKPSSSSRSMSGSSRSVASPKTSRNFFVVT
jgi:hypothetical protein